MPVFNMYFATLVYRNHFHFASWPTENPCGVRGIRTTLLGKVTLFGDKTAQARSCSQGQRTCLACWAPTSSPWDPLGHRRRGACRRGQGERGEWAAPGHPACGPDVPGGTQCPPGPQGRSRLPPGKHSSSTRRNGPTKQKGKHRSRLQKN